MRMASVAGIELVSQLLSFGLHHLVGYLYKKKKKNTLVKQTYMLVREADGDMSQGARK